MSRTALKSLPGGGDEEGAQTNIVKGRMRRRLGVLAIFKAKLVWIASVLVVVIAAVSLIVIGEKNLRQLTTDKARAEKRLAAFQQQLDDAREQVGALTERSSQLQTRVSGLSQSLETARDAKVKTIVNTETVTKEVPRWVPNGKDIAVETTGFSDDVAIHDVQLTNAYGYSDLVGIAINKSGRVISYAELGCSFLDADGGVVANGIANRSNWPPGASWGFDCAAETEATGGVLRVHQIS